MYFAKVTPDYAGVCVCVCYTLNKSKVLSGKRQLSSSGLVY